MSVDTNICDHCLTNPDIYFPCGGGTFNLCFDEITTIPKETFSNQDYCDCIDFTVQDYDNVFDDVSKNSDGDLEVDIGSGLQYDTYYVITLKVLCPCKGLSDFVNLNICIGEPWTCDDPQQSFDCTQYISQYA